MKHVIVVSLQTSIKYYHYHLDLVISQFKNASLTKKGFAQDKGKKMSLRATLVAKKCLCHNLMHTLQYFNVDEGHASTSGGHMRHLGRVFETLAQDNSNLYVIMKNYRMGSMMQLQFQEWPAIKNVWKMCELLSLFCNFQR